MTFKLTFPSPDNGNHQLELEAGEMLFVLGANGTGKSSLMFHFSNQHRDRVRKISAHRQTWMNSDALDMTPSTKVQTEKHIQNDDRNVQSRFRDSYAAQRASMTIYEIIDAENIRARAIAAAYDARDMNALEEAGKVEAPITVINELLLQSNLPIRITIKANERIMASKDGGPEYSAAELSDGERNALLIAGNVLTAPPGTLLIIDEPERHLHRSIISPLLSQLLERRPDCSFVISTHDHDLPLEKPEARTLLLRSCTFNGQAVQNWDADELPAASPYDDTLRRDLVGSRRKILFVEGTEKSLDKTLYSLMFPMVSIIPKGNRHSVEQAVIGARASEALHWLQVFGITDRDGLTPEQVSVSRERGIYAVPYYSVEAVYFHPRVIEKIAVRQAAVTGDEEADLSRAAMSAGVDAIRGHTARLSQNATKKAVREAILAQVPNDNHLLLGEDLHLSNDAVALHTARTRELDEAVIRTDWEGILTACPIRESDALDRISSTLGFRKREHYQKAVRHLLTEDPDELRFVRSLFEDLCDQILDR